MKPSMTICEEVKVRRARLLAADGTMTQGVEPSSAYDVFLRWLCDADQRERVFGGYPEVNVYYEHAARTQGGLL